MSILSTLKSRFATALATLTDDPDSLLDMIRPSGDPKFGDFQANCAMPLAKKVGKSPRDIAADIVSALDVADMCDAPEVAGPGFINLKLKDGWLCSQINSIAGNDRLNAVTADEPKHVVVDFSSPNVAKPMHVGHLRSSVIGDSICRTLKFAGHKVTSDNHVGDWGTQFGMIIYGYRNFLNADAYANHAVDELARLYKLVNQLTDYHSAKTQLDDLKATLQEKQSLLTQTEADADPADKKTKKTLKGLRKNVENATKAIESAVKKIGAVDASPELKALADQHPDIAKLARLETSKLHAGDSDNQKLWDEFLPACLSALNEVYDRLDVSFDLTLGESYYNPMLANVVASLKEKGLATDSDGAVCVFLEGNDAPFIVQKTDAAFTYATTDLATIQYRVETLNADEILYVVDQRQSEHFKLLFETASRWQFKNLQCNHVSFGTVMGDDGRPFKTRSGDSVGLGSLIDEAISRAGKIVAENDERRNVPALDSAQRSQVAQIVGTGGIKYADLHHSRDSDYKFDWDKMLATSGDTAAYMQYAYARICGIFRELDVDRSTISSNSAAFEITDPTERSLALQLLQFDSAIEAVLADYRPHLLTGWLFETANKFSSFYAKCSVKDAESEQIRNSRLVLCDLMARGLKTGLNLLGIKTAEIM
ncbi:MAG: arginine--tRNA ligase [Fuerstiella sp.]